MLHENEIIEALKRAINSENRLLTIKFEVKGITFVNFYSTLYANYNRKVILNVLGEEFEVYSKEDNEDFETVKQRTLYIIKNQLSSMFYQLEKILEQY